MPKTLLGFGCGTRYTSAKALKKISALVRFAVPGAHPEQAHHFAQAVHDATRMHNRGKTGQSTKRLFRIGAATGDITIQPRVGGYDIAGVTIARAVRLETAAQPGELIIDVPTFDSLPESLRVLYSDEVRIRGKLNEEFAARRVVMNPEVPEQLLSSSALACEEAPKSPRAILDLFEQLHPHNLDTLIILLEIPPKDQPSTSLSHKERENRIIQYLRSIPSGLKRLESNLRYLIEKQNTQSPANP